MEKKSEEKSLKSLDAQNVQKVLGTVKSSKDIIWISGSYYSRDQIEENEISNEVPIFATVEQNYENEKVRELILIYSEMQNTILSMDNIQLDEMNTTYDVFMKGAEDIFNDADFFALRLGTFYLDNSGKTNRFECKTPKYKIQLQQPIQVATAEDINLFLEETDYTFIQYFRNIVDTFLIIIPNLYERLLNFDNFNKELFFQRVSEICYRLPPEVISKLIENLESLAKPDKEAIGYVVDVHNDKVEIITKEIFDATLLPMLSIECGQDRIAVLIVKSVEGKKITGSIIYAIHEEELIDSSISILRGYPVRNVLLSDIEITLKPEISSKIQPILIPVGKVIGVFDNAGNFLVDPTKGLPCDNLVERVNGNIESLTGEYQIALMPGELSNGIIIGGSGSGKSNGIKVFITGVLTHNRYGVSQKCGLLVFDREGEYSGMFIRLKDNPDYENLIKIIKIPDDNFGKFKIGEIPLSYFANKSDDESYDQDLGVILKYLKENNLVDIDLTGFNSRNFHLNVDALNFILDVDRFNKIKDNLDKEKHLHKKSIDALYRRINKNIEILQPILQIKQNEKGLYEEIKENFSIRSILKNAQEKGLILILDISRLPSESYSKFTNLVQKDLQDEREKWYKKELEQSGGNQFEFTKKAPLFLQINEEATYLFASMRDNQDLTFHIRAATGSRKFNMGTVYVFQSLEGISANIKLILTQLGGFSIVFSVTMRNDRELTIKNANIQEMESMDNFIHNAKRFKLCVTSCETYSNRPFFVKFYKAEDYFMTIFNIEINEQSERDKTYLKKKELKKDEPLELKSSKRKNKENIFESVKNSKFKKVNK